MFKTVAIWLVSSLDVKEKESEAVLFFFCLKEANCSFFLEAEASLKANFTFL